MKFEKRGREPLRFVAIKGHGKLDIHPFDRHVSMKSLPVYEQNTKYCSFGSFLLMFGSEIDSKFDIHHSFIVVI